MKFKNSMTVLLGTLLIVALAFSARAMFELKWTVEKLYKETKTVVIGKVVEVVAENRVVNVTLTQALKGKLPGAKIRVQVVKPADLLKDIKADQPIVLFLTYGENGADAKAVIHIADRWVLADGIPKSELLVWRVVDANDAVNQSFPGRTSALVKLVTDLNAGTSTFLDKSDSKSFVGGMRKRAKLNVQNATWIMAEDVNGDKKPDLLIGTTTATRLFLAKGDDYEDATEQWGLNPAPAKYHAIGDYHGDGKPGLLLDNTLWINQGNKFVASKSTFEIPTKGAPLAAAFVDTNGDQKLDAVFLTSEGELRIFENPGVNDKPWALRTSKPLWTGGDAPFFAAVGDFGDTGKPHAIVLTKSGVTRYAFDADGGVPSDVTRLTGVDFKKKNANQNGFQNATAVVLSMNGESRPDVLIFSDAGGLLLFNRGLGTFFPDESVSDSLTSKGTTPLPLTPTPASVWTRANLHGKGIDDVLLLGPDGTLYEMNNSNK